MCKAFSLTGRAIVKLSINNRAILNIKNIDNFCVTWSILVFFETATSTQDKRAGYRLRFDKRT